MNAAPFKQQGQVDPAALTLLALLPIFLAWRTAPPHSPGASP